ncbi:MAG: PBP1A family penicillin-binding protein [Bryobacteraceae bacterium]|jgi:penicillin-binding protein 1B
MDPLTEIDETASQQPAPQANHVDWNRLLKWTFIATGVLMLLAIAAIAVPYFKLARWVDRQLAAGPFQHTYSFYAASAAIGPGDQESQTEVVAALRRCGLRFDSLADTVIVRGDSPARIDFVKGRVAAITDLTSNKKLDGYELPPQLITNLSDEGRAKRLMIHYADLPPVLVQAIVSAEDKRFFKHEGLDVLRIAKATYVDLKEGRKEQGASTITMQLARNLWLDHDKRWKRKIAESLITLHLERKLSKEQILEYYCNQVYLGGAGTFSINGFGEAARVYFNKDVRNLNLNEAATLAGLVQRPSYFNPLRYPEHALERRNIVLALMRENHYVSSHEYEKAIGAPLGLWAGANGMPETQYFLDIASDQLQRHVEEHGAGSANVYTTIDLRLQRAAEQAVEDGMAQVDQLLAKSRKRGAPETGRPQVALIALDPHTGDVKALIGGRNYSISQLDRVLAKRPPGSVFKPFVYTVAIESAIDGSQQVLTPASTIDDEPTTFDFDDQTYTPANFRQEFMGQVTLRQALAHSLNVATVKLAQEVGYDNVVALAHRAGLNGDIKATPAVALGAYQVTPLEIASAYTIFANGGTRVTPNFIDAIRSHDGDTVYEHQAELSRVLDPRVAFIMTDMLQEVMRSGTAAGVRTRGFKLPAAGKTGTSHDGWFAGYTSQLLCIVWVGFDDYSDLHLEGARSALPIWTEFMMNAARYKDYRDAKPFAPPAGVVRGAYCPGGESDYFIDGTQPTDACPDPAGEADRIISQPQ